MVILKLIGATVFPTVLGLSFVNLFLNHKKDINIFERLAFGFLAGMMLLVLEMLLLSQLKIAFSLLFLTLPWIPLIVIGLYFGYKNSLFSLEFKLNRLKLPRLTPPGLSSAFTVRKSAEVPTKHRDEGGLNWIEIALILFICFEVFFVFSSTLIKPVVTCDAWSNYSWRGKMFFIEKTSIVKNTAQTGHPLYNCLNQTWVFMCLNDWNDLLGKIFYPLYYLSLLVIFYFTVSRKQTRFFSLLATAMLASLPFLIYHASTAYADFPLATYYFAGISLLFLFFNRPKINYLLLAALFLLSTATIKNEAYFYLFMTFIVFAATIFMGKFKEVKGIKSIRITTIALALLGTAFMTYKIFFSSHEALRYAPTLDFTRVWPLLLVFTDYLFVRGNFSIVWFLLILLLIFNFKKLKNNFNLSLLALVLLNLFGLMAYYFVLEQTMFDWLFYVTPAVRNILQFMPIVLLLVGNLLVIKNKNEA
ncbi:MAG: hypothetical protein HQ596_05710 [Candidatus Saganbacteria bacterium]|nr:hypothetical protein [Candidatus Saganbacteria bacterium]